MRKTILLFLCYLITAKIGLSLDPVSGFATLVWPPTGIALAGVLLYGYKVWPAIFLAAFLANFTSDAPFPVALVIAGGNTLEALIPAYLLQRYFDFNSSLKRLKDTLALIFVAAVFGTMISATIGSLVLFLSKTITVEAFNKTWLAWWMGDMLANLVLTPVLLVWLSKPLYNYSSRRFIEAFMAISLLILVEFLIFTSPLILSVPRFPIASLFFPPLIWIALRFGQRGSVSAVFGFAVLATLATVYGLGPFATTSLSESLISLQALVGISAATIMILAAVVSERRDLEKRKDEFISIASHELKSPLATLKGYLDFLKVKHIRQKKETQYLDRMSEQVNKLTRLINELLDTSRMGTEKFVLVLTIFDLNELIAETIKDVKQTKARNRIVFDKTPKPLIVTADKYRLGQVIYNLLKIWNLQTHTRIISEEVLYLT